jgi:hypothetical protein
MNKTTIIAIAVSLFVGTIVGYWYRGRVLLTQEQMTAAAIATAPPQVLKLAPPSKEPAPWISGAPGRKP